MTGSEIDGSRLSETGPLAERDHDADDALAGDRLATAGANEILVAAKPDHRAIPAHQIALPLGHIRVNGIKHFLRSQLRTA